MYFQNPSTSGDAEGGQLENSNGRKSASLQSSYAQSNNEKTSLLKDSIDDENPFLYSAEENDQSQSRNFTISSERRLLTENTTT